MCEFDALDYIQDRLSPAEKLQFLEHVIRCDDCILELRELLQMKTAMDETLVEAPVLDLRFGEANIYERLQQTLNPYFKTTKEALAIYKVLLRTGGIDL